MSFFFTPHASSVAASSDRESKQSRDEDVDSRGRDMGVDSSSRGSDMDSRDRNVDSRGRDNGVDVGDGEVVRLR